ncbi:UdgX family uracil-DNA binding protein [Methylocystis sp. 9N]|uniref:Type-4 uracil-DNA glycosylase n=1 Tax=Methylocystis borbori TaxID=3118750 RepID=A0ABU7XJD9_9HYPH
MRQVHLALMRDDDVEGFLAQAADALRSTMRPEDIIWSVGASADLFAASARVGERMVRSTPLPQPFIELARSAALHNDRERFALLYTLLWRVRRTPNLLQIDCDPQVARAHIFAKAVRRDIHKMKAFIRFRRVLAPDGEEAFVAWFEPDHHIVSAVAPFFVKRFANMRWSILCPRGSAHWDGATLTIGDGATRSDAPSHDELEREWRVYFSSIFNPSRLKVKAMTAQMPKKYWRNLPEAPLIAPLIRDAAARSSQMVAAPPTRPSRYARRGAAPALDKSAMIEAETLAALAEEEVGCARCPLYKNATQVVPGEGPPQARVMLIGEQPGDQEDLAGRPFVGPAGKLLDIALARAGVAREICFVTNAVKHFKFEPRGKRRLHKKPDAGEIDACRWWLDRERALLRPGLIVALGATAIRGALGRSEAVSRLRGEFIELEDGAQFLATVHPSSLLRLKDESDKRQAWRGFLADLRKIASWIEKDDARIAG